jgi:hypothetical protein
MPVKAATLKADLECEQNQDVLYAWLRLVGVRLVSIDAEGSTRVVRRLRILPANAEKNREPTSGLEALTCSLRVRFREFAGVHCVS